MLKAEILYHANCKDGFGAAWAAWKKFGENTRYRPVNYGKPVPDTEPGVPVFILDFSYPRNDLEGLALWSGSVTVIDHHKTAYETLRDIDGVDPAIKVIFDMEKSGAVLAWEFFHPEEMVPRILEYVQDRDLWAWKLPGSREFSAALSLEPTDFKRWDDLEHGLSSDIGRETFLQRGEAVLATQEVLIEAALKNVYLSDVDGHRVWTVNSPVLQSEIGERLCGLRPPSAFAAVWSAVSAEEEVWSLRSRGGFDVSEVAKALGGGGHAPAAGFKRRRS
jgi:oligoribonuclease NrnB/cAMP/cGMP phosphodiesterase (DHH superfamily)